MRCSVWGEIFLMEKKRMKKQLRINNLSFKSVIISEHDCLRSEIKYNWVTKYSHTLYPQGAVCKFLTLLKHKNTIICLQIFKKHAKLTYLFIWKQSVILLWKCAFRAGMSVSVLVYETRPLPVYPVVFWHPRLPAGGTSSLRSRGRVKKTPLQYFEFGLQYLVQLLCVNSTYSTFKLTDRNLKKKCESNFWIYSICYKYW